MNRLLSLFLVLSVLLIGTASSAGTIEFFATISESQYSGGEWSVVLETQVVSPYTLTFDPTSLNGVFADRNFVSDGTPSSSSECSSVPAGSTDSICTQKQYFKADACDALVAENWMVKFTADCRPGAPSGCQSTQVAVVLNVNTGSSCYVEANYPIGTTTMELDPHRNEGETYSTEEDITFQVKFNALPSQLSASYSLGKVCAYATPSSTPTTLSPCPSNDDGKVETQTATLATGSKVAFKAGAEAIKTASGVTSNSASITVQVDVTVTYAGKKRTESRHVLLGRANLVVRDRLPVVEPKLLSVNELRQRSIGRPNQRAQAQARAQV